MAAKQERSEDLNPRSQDLDEKIRQLLDPSIPDNPPAAEEPKSAAAKIEIKEVAGKKSLEQAPTEDVVSDVPDPTLPVKKERKVIVPVVHDDGVVEPEPRVEEVKPKKKPAKEPKSPVVQIDINHTDETKEEVAEKLDAAIADLSETPVKALESEQPETENEVQAAEESAEPATAPLLDGAEETTDPEPVHEEPVKPEKVEPSAPEPEEPEEDEPLPEPKVINEPETDKAVKDIVTTEGDELLKVEDSVRKVQEPSPKPKRGLKAKTIVKIFIWLLLLGTAGTLGYPTSRYFALNTAGLRASSSFKVIDDSTQQPLSTVSVELGGQTASTDADGLVRFSNLKLGNTTMRVTRVAFAPVEKAVTLGWGSNPLGDVALKPTGARYKISVVDKFSGKAVLGAEAEADGVSAKADDKGLITLTVAQTEKHDVVVTVKAPSYRDEKHTIKADFKDVTTTRLVPAERQIFISKHGGTFGIYTIYADGTGEKLLLAGTGKETEELAIMPRTLADEIAYVSTRAGKRNSAGALMTDLVLISRESGKLTALATAERIQLIGWADQRLLYVTVAGDDKATSPKRTILYSYNLTDKKTTEIASSNYFNDLLAMRGQIYYAPSSAYPGGTLAQWFKSGADGGAQKALLEKEVWALTRTGYDRVLASVGQDWYEYVVGETVAKKLESAPASQKSRVYADAPGGQKSAWVDQRDGKGVLVIYDIASKKEQTLVTRSGLSQPLVWLSASTLIFRVETGSETADYVVSTEGGEPQKVRDVTKTSSTDNWYQY